MQEQTHGFPHGGDTGFYMKDFTPVVWQNGLLTTDVIEMRYARWGDLVIMQGGISILSAGTANNRFSMSLPYPCYFPNNSTHARGTTSFRTGCIGSFVYLQAGVTFHTGSVKPFNGTPITPILNWTKFQMGGTVNDELGANPNIAAASGDELHVSLQYFVKDGS